jgi:hypothetical protein
MKNNYTRFVTWMIAFAFCLITWGYVVVLFRGLFSHSPLSW